MSELVPDWITNDFLTQVLQKEEGKENVTVSSFTATFPVPAGNNYASNIIGLKVEYKYNICHDSSNFVSLIVKDELTAGPVRKTSISPESAFYHEFIPEAKNLMEMSFVPKSYNSPRPNDIILADLKDEGFILADRLKQLDYDHCRMYVIAAAKLHAVSVAVYKHRPELINMLGKENLFSNEIPIAKVFKTVIKFAINILVEETIKINRFKKYAKVIEDSIPHLWDMMVEAHQPREGLKTINQGDPWTTNMMFKYDEQGKVADIKLLDFQFLRYGSPANDIVFFIWSSADNNVKKQHLNKLYQTYISTLNNKLEELNCTERLTHDEFMEGVKRLSPVAFYWAGVPTVTFPEPIDFGMLLRHQEGEGGSEIRMFFNRIFNDNFCTNHLPDILESLELNGVFEHLKNYKR